MKHATKFATFGLVVTGLALANPVLADEDDGAPHIAVVYDGSGYELEFAIEAGLDTGTNPPTITIITPTFDAFEGGYFTEPINDTPLPNDDLGFVSEVEAPDPAPTFAGKIIVRMLSKSSNFEANFVDPIFTDLDPNFELFTNVTDSFDTHPVWVLANAEGDLTPATASFEVLEVGGASEVSIGTFDVILAVPEPSSALALLAGAGLIAARRRRRG